MAEGETEASRERKSSQNRSGRAALSRLLEKSRIEFFQLTNHCQSYSWNHVDVADDLHHLASYRRSLPSNLWRCVSKSKEWKSNGLKTRNESSLRRSVMEKHSSEVKKKKRHF